MKFFKRFWPFFIVPGLIVILHILGLAISPVSSANNYSETVMTFLYRIPFFFFMWLERIVIGDCPGLGFDGGPCETAEYTLVIGSIALWWLLLTAVIGGCIQAVRHLRQQAREK